MGQLRPATVEELAAQERASSPPTVARRVLSGRPLVIALATACLLSSGAGAFALARTGPNATIVQPYGLDAPFGVGYVDGFGEHSPKPSGNAATTSSRSRRSAGVVAPSPSAGPSTDVLVVTPSSPALPAGEVNAVYWTTTWYGNYDTYVWVHNEGTSDAAWEVRITLPAGATVNTAMAAQRSYVDGAWFFKPSRGRLLPGGQVYLFAFSGTKPSGRFSLRSCTVNGLGCRSFS
jgi:hypothetical protein